MPCGHTRLHSPQSVHLPATWKARMIWNIFSSKESTFAFCALSNLLLSNTHLRQLQAGRDISAGVTADALAQFALEIRKTLLRADRLNPLYLGETLLILRILRLARSAPS